MLLSDICRDKYHGGNKISKLGLSNVKWRYRDVHFPEENWRVLLQDIFMHIPKMAKNIILIIINLKTKKHKFLKSSKQIKL